ncbi:hypothetical protein F4781DRAFT_437910 [Annulohypoxylon bovei var. microspora]|nr:hypothetical protein F4781DRAFT_437910 [Annulohypoxylon bovei var. microspora]
MLIIGGVLGNGANGVVYRIPRVAEGQIKRFAVKIAPNDVDLGGIKPWDEDDETPDEIQSLLREKLRPKRFRNGLHVMKPFDMPDEPLARTPDGVAPHRMRDWIFTEHAENGAARTPIARHREQYEEEQLPSRLLRRLRMCLIRACIEMAYYDAAQHGQPADPTTATLESPGSIAPGPLAHQDLGSHNVVVGAATLDDGAPEHDATPIPKLIDFGEAGELDPTYNDYEGTGPERNVADIAEESHGVPPAARREAARRGRSHRRRPDLRDLGGSAHQQRDNLVAGGEELDLIDLAYLCMSAENHARPGLVALAETVHERVANRGPDGTERETDQAIRGRISAPIHDGDTDTRKRPRDEDGTGTQTRTRTTIGQNVSESTHRRKAPRKAPPKAHLKRVCRNITLDGYTSRVRVEVYPLL